MECRVKIYRSGVQEGYRGVWRPLARLSSRLKNKTVACFVHSSSGLALESIAKELAQPIYYYPWKGGVRGIPVTTPLELSHFHDFAIKESSILFYSRYGANVASLSQDNFLLEKYPVAYPI